MSNSASAHGEEAAGFIFLQLIGFTFVVVLALIFVKKWRYKLIVIYASLPIGIFLDSIPSSLANQSSGNHALLSAFSITVIPSLVLMFVYWNKRCNPIKDLSKSINSIVNLKAIYIALEILVLVPVLMATLAIIVLIADSIYVDNMALAFNKIELHTSESAVVSLMGKPSNITECSYHISAADGTYVLPGNYSGSYKECITEARYESFFHGWAIGYTESTNVISKYEYLLIKPNLSFKRDWLKPASYFKR